MSRALVSRAVEGARGARDRRVRERVVSLLNACFLTDLPLAPEERYLLREIAGFVLREGLGDYSIGRRLWPSLNPRTAQKRVQRLLARWERLVRQCSLRNVSNRDVSILRQGEDGIIDSEDDKEEGEFRKPPDSLLYLPEPVWKGRIKRLGRTERIVLAALERLGGRERFSVIVNEFLLLLGLERTLENRERYKNRVWQALRRLSRRGLVGYKDGVYWLSGPVARSRLLVENFRGVNEYGKTVQVWSKKDHGYAAPLEYVLTLAALRGIKRVVQVELDEILGESRILDRLGVTIIKIYKAKDQPYNNKWKLEIALDHPNLTPDILHHSEWISTFLEAKKEARRLIR